MSVGCSVDAYVASLRVGASHQGDFMMSEESGFGRFLALFHICVAILSVQCRLKARHLA
jgi:hypothetical protein